ncbi:uncharacterized protein LOC119294757 [Triticum dicoccoides]|uniref:uncharacterized protein LOC119294757 n=1 Tax=Triticum dicoccoides TaxID=85692 RepID=UPI00188EDCD5|nr:uncharacterized protein LOC119294757 [Triticum dicoccoides]
MAMAAAHQIPKVAHTLVEIAEVARYAYEHRSGHAPDHDGATAMAADGEEAARLRAENAVLRARLADDLALLRELQGAPFVSQECPPDLHNRLVASVNNAGFLAHLEKVRDEPLHQHTKLSIGGVTEVDIGDIPYTKDEGKTGSWLLVSCDTAGGNLEEISGIDDENYVMVNEDDIVDAIATFVARCILEDPKSKSLSSKELQKAVATALSSMTDRKKGISFWEAGKVIYILATWGITIAGLYRSRAVLKMAAKGAVVSTKFIMKAL